MRLPFAETGEPLRAFWQARFYDFNVYSKGKKREKLNYIHANPVIRGLVRHPKDWAWSSWGFYWGRTAGLVAIDVEERDEQATPRPRFKRRTWGTLRVALVCEWGRDVSFDQHETSGFGSGSSEPSRPWGTRNPKQ